MFTGIVQKVGMLREVTPSPQGGTLCLSCTPWERPYEVGESIAVQGVCLSLVREEEGCLFFDVLRETFDRTNLGDARPGDRLNLERALRYGDALGGHLLSGHIDDTAVVHSIEPAGRDRVVTLSCPASLMHAIVYKGSVACDGISLTVAHVGEGQLSLHLIPMTLAHTGWSTLEVGDRVNIEVDLLAKYAAHLLAAGRPLAPPTNWDGFTTTPG